MFFSISMSTGIEWIISSSLEVSLLSSNALSHNNSVSKETLTTESTIHIVDQSLRKVWYCWFRVDFITYL